MTDLWMVHSPGLPVRLVTDTAGVEHRGPHFGEPSAVEHRLEYDQE